MKTNSSLAPLIREAMQNQIASMPIIIMKIIKVLWVGAAIFVLYVTLDAFYNVRDNGIWDVLTWLMFILCFPAGLVVSLVLWVLEATFSITVKVSYSSLVLVWAGYFIMGYLQWFKFVPYLVTKIQRFNAVRRNL